MATKPIDTQETSSLAMRDPWRRLMLAIVVQAVADVHGPYPGHARKAKAWLAESGHDYLQAAGMGISPVWFKRWVADGCPDYRNLINSEV
jgi:hypothetical protein